MIIYTLGAHRTHVLAGTSDQSHALLQHSGWGQRGHPGRSSLHRTVVRLMLNTSRCVPRRWSWWYQISRNWPFTLWLFNIAMENGPFIDGLPIKNGDFPWRTVSHNQRVPTEWGVDSLSFFWLFISVWNYSIVCNFAGPGWSYDIHPPRGDV